MFDLLKAAAKQRSDLGFSYILSGDVGQMSAQKNFLQGQGFRIGQIDVCPALATKEDYYRAIKLIWKHRIDGWWHYQQKLVELGECTEKEFSRALDAAVETERKDR